MAQPFDVDGAGRSLASPAFPGDDGVADPEVRRITADAAAGSLTSIEGARLLRGTRLLATVVAVLDQDDETGADKDSHMAVVSMVNAAGEKGLLAFTGIDSLALWNPQARPVPALGRDLARAAIEDGAAAVVVDVAGPAACVVSGSALNVLADHLDLPQVDAVVSAALAPLTADGWCDARIGDARSDDAGVDVVVEICAVGGGHPDGRRLEDLTRQAARILAERADLRALVPGGIGVRTASARADTGPGR